MKKPSLVSSKTKDKYYKKKVKSKNDNISQKVSLFLMLFLMGGIVISYYKYLVRQRTKQNILY